MSGVDNYKYDLDKGPQSNIVRAAHHMARAYHDYDMMLEAVDEVQHDFPMIDRDDLMTMWIAVNAANQNTGDAG